MALLTGWGVGAVVALGSPVAALAVRRAGRGLGGHAERQAALLGLVMVARCCRTR